MTEDERKAARAAYMREYAKRGTHGACSVDGCERPSYGRSGLCAMHYKRREATGEIGEASPRFMQGFTVRARWEAKVDKNGPVPDHRPDLGPCWLWTAGQFPDGYGLLVVDRKSRGAHCVGYELLGGPIPDGLELDHLCRVRRCVRPSHLEPVTPKVNKLRGNGKPAQHARQTECIRGHPLEGPDALLCPDPRLGRRICRLCVRINRNERYRRTGK